jgi:hypothetical protein
MPHCLAHAGLNRCSGSDSHPESRWECRQQLHVVCDRKLRVEGLLSMAEYGVVWLGATWQRQAGGLLMPRCLGPCWHDRHSGSDSHSKSSWDCRNSCSLCCVGKCHKDESLLLVFGVWQCVLLLVSVLATWRPIHMPRCLGPCWAQQAQWQ